MKTLSVICPVYNEEEVITSFYTELKSVLAGLEDRYVSTILFVVDQCTDQTLTVLKEIARADASIRILAMSSRFGHQMALLAGIDHSHTDAVVMLDSDLQHPPALIPEMLAAFEQGYDVIYTLRQDTADTGFFKRFSSRLFYYTINVIAQVPIKENAADFRLLSRRVIEVFQTQVRERNMFLRGLVSWVGFRSIGISFQVRQRGAGKSKYSLGRMIRFGVEGVVSFSKRPLQAAIFIGLGFAIFGMTIALETFAEYFYDSSLPSGWATPTPG